MSRNNLGHEVPLPPCTNRGVIRTNQNVAGIPCVSHDCLTVMVDWCQLTVKGLRPIEISEKLLRIPFWLMSNDFRGGLSGGYRALMCFDDIRVYEPSGKNKDNGYQVVMAGKGCRNYEKFLEANNETWYDFFERALTFGVNFPRIDLAIDDYKTYFKISELAQLAQNNRVITRLRIGDSHVGFDLGGNKKRGDTLYIGSRMSEFYMCFYEKGYERAEKTGCELIEDWNRYELRFRQKRAVNLARVLIERRDVASVALEVLNESIRFVEKPENSVDTKIRRYPLWKPWAEFMRDVGKLKLTTKPETKDYYDRLAWLEKSVFPTLKAYIRIDEIMGTSVIQEMLDNTQLNKKHQWIVESCVKQLQAEVGDCTEKIELARAKVELYKLGFVDYDGFRVPFD